MKTFFILTLLVICAAGQTQPRKPAARAAAPGTQPATPSGVDAIVALLKSGMSETLVLKAIQTEGKAYKLSAADMLKLQQAGASERVLETLLNPAAANAAAAPGPATTAASASAEAAAAEAALTPASLPAVRRATPKRRLAVMPFDHSAVAQWVHYWFRSDYNVGQGIRAMLTARLAQSKNIVLLERARLDAIEKELKLNNTSMVNQGTKANMGRVSGADCMLLGDIVIFGRDDKSERSRSSGGAFRSLLSRAPVVGTRVASMGQFSKEEKAVVAIALRIVDTETGEVLESAEARGESGRSSKNWDSFVLGNAGHSSQRVDMTSSNFEATIIGEATSNAVDEVVRFLEDRIPKMPLRSRSVEGRVAKVTATNNLILGIGANDGVQTGDHFEIHRIIDEVIDPVSREVLDVQTEKVGEFVATTVRERIATGSYTGKALSEGHPKGYTARLIIQ
jgi:curli biogenesis system outer membrane secretion channel CsgG